MCTGYKVPGWAPVRVTATPLRPEEVESVTRRKRKKCCTNPGLGSRPVPQTNPRLHPPLLPNPSCTLSLLLHISGWGHPVAEARSLGVKLYCPSCLPPLWDESPGPSSLPMDFSHTCLFSPSPCPRSRVDLINCVCATMIMGPLSLSCVFLCSNFHNLVRVIFPK